MLNGYCFLAMAMSTALDRCVQKPPPQGSARTTRCSATLNPILQQWQPRMSSQPQMKELLLSMRVTNMPHSHQLPQRTICRRRRCSTRWTHNPQLQCPMLRKTPLETSLRTQRGQDKGRVTDAPAKPTRRHAHARATGLVLNNLAHGQTQLPTRLVPRTDT